MVRKVQNIDPDPRYITPRQKEVLLFIRDFRARTGYSPTMEEIAEHLDVSKVTVFEHVTVLQVKGWLQRTRRRARSLMLADPLPASDMLEAKEIGLPLAGKIAAGVPIEAIENLERMDLHQVFRRNAGTFLLKVEGDSMTGDHICPGDLAVIEQRSEARDGDIVVALVADNDATLKRLRHQPDGTIQLLASNPAYPPRLVNPEELRIQGVLIGVIRAL